MSTQKPANPVGTPHEEEIAIAVMVTEGPDHVGVYLELLAVRQEQREIHQDQLAVERMLGEGR